MEQNIIESEDYIDYKPPISVDINQLGGTIPISLYNEDIKTCPHRSFLIINGKLTFKKNSDGTILNSIDTKKVNFINNGILHLFSRINYSIAGNEIDSIDNPRISTAIKGIVSFNDDIAYHDACWRIKSTSNIINKDGYFSIFIPLKVILGFFEDYTNYVYRIHQELKLIRANTNCNNALLVDGTIANAHTISINYFI